MAIQDWTRILAQEDPSEFKASRDHYTKRERQTDRFFLDCVIAQMQNT